MDREHGYQLVVTNVKNKNLVKHMLAVEAVMRALARRLGEDEEMWSLAGLVHDVDLGQTLDKPKKHALVAAEMLEKEGAPPQVIQAVRAHNEILCLPRKSLMDKALYAADPLTGLIVAAALIHPKKKLKAIDSEFVLNRFKEKHFARGASRKQINACTELDLSLEEFIELGVTAMQAESEKLGL
jgi:uncharacterized protein